MADDPDARTSAIGLFNYARSFWQSGICLQGTLVQNATHPQAPVTMLLCQAIELYLKAFLRLKGFDVKRLEGLRHRYKSIAVKTTENGLPLSKLDQEVIRFLADTNAFLKSRYIVTGSRKILPPETISKTCSNLDELVGTALLDAGHSLRRLT